MKIYGKFVCSLHCHSNIFTPEVRMIGKVWPLRSIWKRTNFTPPITVYITWSFTLSTAPVHSLNLQSLPYMWYINTHTHDEHVVCVYFFFSTRIVERINREASRRSLLLVKSFSFSLFVVGSPQSVLFRWSRVS